MVIIFSNQKGGCGKTTLCIQFANYLAEKGIKIHVIDVDFQQSIVDRRKEDLSSYNNEALYEVESVELGNVGAYIQDFKRVNDGHLLIDLPGNIEDVMAAIFKSADLIICPFRYDKMTMDSTGTFIAILKHLNVQAKIFFVPNNIRQSIKYELKESIIEILLNVGFVTKDVPNRVILERVNTLIITDEAIKILKPVYDYIIEHGVVK